MKNRRTVTPEEKARIVLEALEKENTEQTREIKKLEDEKEELFKKVGQLTIEVDWLKKNLVLKDSAADRISMIDRDTEITLARQCELLDINRTRIYYEPLFGEKQTYKREIIRLIDRDSQNYKYASVFVAVLPASSYPFARAYTDETSPNWICAHADAFEYFGGGSCNHDT